MKNVLYIVIVHCTLFIAHSSARCHSDEVFDTRIRTLLTEAIDSVVSSNHLSEANLLITLDPALQKYDKPRTSIQRVTRDTLILDIDTLGSIVRRSTDGSANAEYVLRLDGMLYGVSTGYRKMLFRIDKHYCCDPLGKNAEIPKEEPSFWNSFAQPILVTTGAALAIVLFFLIRS